MKKQKKILAKIFSAVFVLALLKAQVAFGQWNPNDYTGTALSHQTIYGIIHNIVSWLLKIFGFLAIIGFVISGIMYLLAAGDEDTQARAKRAMIYSITGVIVGLVGLVVIYAVDAILFADEII